MSEIDQGVSLGVDGHEIFNSLCQKLLGVKIDNKLNFGEHVTGLCTNTGQKLIMLCFILSQFGYCPLVWMFHSRKLNNRINRIHRRALV